MNSKEQWAFSILSEQKKVEHEASLRQNPG